MDRHQTVLDGSAILPLLTHWESGFSQVRFRDCSGWLSRSSSRSISRAHSSTRHASFSSRWPSSSFPERSTTASHRSVWFLSRSSHRTSGVAIRRNFRQHRNQLRCQRQDRIRAHPEEACAAHVDFTLLPYACRGSEATLCSTEATMEARDRATTLATQREGRCTCAVMDRGGGLSVVRGLLRCPPRASTPQ